MKTLLCTCVVLFVALVATLFGAALAADAGEVTFASIIREATILGVGGVAGAAVWCDPEVGYWSRVSWAVVGSVWVTTWVLVGFAVGGGRL